MITTTHIAVPIAALIVILIFIIMTSLRIKLRENTDKSRPYECGFDPKSGARIPFSNRFFLLSVLFLVFDIEIILIFPAPLVNMWSSQNLLQRAIFLLILLLGLFHEWNEGSLDWAK